MADGEDQGSALAPAADFDASILVHDGRLHENEREVAATTSPRSTSTRSTGSADQEAYHSPSATSVASGGSLVSDGGGGGELTDVPGPTTLLLLDDLSIQESWRAVILAEGPPWLGVKVRVWGSALTWDTRSRH